MTIIVDDNLIGLWFLDASKHSRDWMGGLSRRAPGEFVFLWRIRYHVDDKAFDSADTKRWAEGVHKGTEAEALARARMFVRLMAAAWHLTPADQTELIKGDQTTEQFTLAIARLPFAHRETVSDDEFRKLYGRDPPR